jgi:hypothetical protein
MTQLPPAYHADTRAFDGYASTTSLPAYAYAAPSTSSTGVNDSFGSVDAGVAEAGSGWLAKQKGDWKRKKEQKEQGRLQYEETLRRKSVAIRVG